MQRDVRSYLWDVCDAADAIRSFVDGIDFETYAASALVHSAVERKFEIIGEALNQLSKVDKSTAAHIPDLESIVAFRNLLIHGYAVVEHDRVWRIINEFLPRLRATTEALLKEPHD